MFGGVETFLVTLAREAGAAPGMTSSFAVCFEGRLTHELAAAGSPPFMLGRARLSRPLTLVRTRRALARLLRQEAFDVVVCHQPWAYVIFGAVVRAAGLPVVLWIHMAGEGRRWLERLACRRAPALTICNSRFSADCLSRWPLGSRVQQIYCPVSAVHSSADAAARVRLRASLGTPPGDTVIVQVSRLEAWKGQHVLLAALPHLSGLSGWSCWIVGGPQSPAEASYLRDLQAAAAAAGIADRVRFLGQRRDVPEVLAAADLFCQPNTSPEPFGIALVEALGAGLPVVTSNIGGAREIVDDSCGILTAPGDPLALAGVLRRLVVERASREALSAAARARPDALCNASRQMAEISDVLAGVAAGSQAASPSGAAS
jgi:glycosyltransferase involved in cell wall biosynthesis